MAELIRITPDRVLTASGALRPGAAYRAFFYLTGTTTPVTVYQDDDLTVPHASPVLADATGTFPAIFYGGTSLIKAVIQTSTGATYATIDPCVRVALDVSSAAGITFAPTVEIPETDVQAAIEAVAAMADTKQPEDVQLTALAGVTAAANKIPMFTGSDAATVIDRLDEDTMVSDSDTGVPTQQSVKAYVDGRTPLSKEYNSTAQTITTAGALVLAHGLGANPKIVSAYIKCLTAEAGYSIGDEIPVSVSQGSYGSVVSIGISMVKDATNLNIRYSSNASVFAELNKTTGTLAQLTNANWQLYVSAWA